VAAAVLIGMQVCVMLVLAVRDRRAARAAGPATSRTHPPTGAIQHD
jgi:hypothetical protein